MVFGESRRPAALTSRWRRYLGHRPFDTWLPCASLASNATPPSTSMPAGKPHSRASSSANATKYPIPFEALGPEHGADDVVGLGFRRDARQTPRRRFQVQDQRRGRSEHAARGNASTLRRNDACQAHVLDISEIRCDLYTMFRDAGV